MSLIDMGEYNEQERDKIMDYLDSKRSKDMSNTQEIKQILEQKHYTSNDEDFFDGTAVPL